MSDEKLKKDQLEEIKKSEKVLNITLFIGFILFLVFAATRFYKFYDFKVQTMKSNTWDGELKWTAGVKLDTYLLS